MSATTSTTAVTMPAMALVPSLDSVAPSVAAAAVALLVALLDALLMDTLVLVALELVAMMEEESVVAELPSETSLDDWDAVAEPLAIVEDTETVSDVDDGLEVEVMEKAEVVSDAVATG